MKALKEAGAAVDVVAPKSGTIRGWNHRDKADSIPVDQLRLEPKAIEFIRHFIGSGKPIAAICHDPWTLIDAGGVRGRRITIWPSLKADLSNAGAQWEDAEVVTDRGLVTSRKSDDIPAFTRKMIEEFREGRHDRG